MSKKLDLDRYNERITEAGLQLVTDMQQAGASEGIVHRKNSPSKGASLPRMKAGFTQDDGAVNSVGIKLRRSLVYVHKGAGKGRGGSKGSKWVDKFKVEKSTNPNSLGKMGTGGRRAKPFINEVLDGPEGVEKIATIAAEEIGDAIVAKIMIQ
jgi:hypothetical protein